MIAPPAIYLEALHNVLQHSSIKVAAQNVHEKASGAFTGETSATMLKDLGLAWTLIGHSERRQYFGETSQVKLDYHSHDLQPRISFVGSWREAEGCAG